MATVLPTRTSLATEPVKLSPALLTFDPTAEPKLIVIAVPAGTTSGSFFSARCSACSLRSLGSLAVELSGLAAGWLSGVEFGAVLSLGGLLQPITNAR